MVLDAVSRLGLRDQTFRELVYQAGLEISLVQPLVASEEIALVRLRLKTKSSLAVVEGSL